MKRQKIETYTGHKRKYDAFVTGNATKKEKIIYYHTTIDKQNEKYYEYMFF
jgi:hypothetical protein